MKDPMEILDKHFDGLLDEAEAAELCRWVKEDPLHARIVTRASMIHQRLRQVMRGRQLLEETASLGTSLDDAMILPSITLEPENEASSDAAPDASPQPPATTPVAPPKSSSQRRLWRLAAAIAIPVLVGIVLWSILRPAKPGGDLVASASAVWDTAVQPPHDGQPLPAGPLQLASGLAQIRLDNGVSLVVEGPSHFEIQSQNSVSLQLGKITVSVPPNAHGFTIVTPSSRTVDLGTEFGIIVDKAGNTETHVIRGTVEVTPKAGGAALLLSAEQAARVDVGVSSAQRIECHTGNFVQDVPAIDLVDLIAGGDGTQRQSNGGIDIASGTILPVPTDKRSVQTALNRGVPGDGKFHPCPSLPLGVFIPHGGPKPDTLDAAGDQYIFPPTCNLAYQDIWPGNIETRVGIEPTNTGRIGAIDYASSGHRLLRLHANKGITFDLDALRNAHPNRPFSHFVAVCVNINAYVERTGRKVSDRSEFWVFVDGDLRSHKLIHLMDPPFDVDVPIEPAAHSLTLVSTDGGDGLDWDVVSLGDPRLK